jgi:hypothetical protein
VFFFTFFMFVFGVIAFLVVMDFMDVTFFIDAVRFIAFTTIDFIGALKPSVPKESHVCNH